MVADDGDILIPKVFLVSKKARGFQNKNTSGVGSVFFVDYANSAYVS